MESKLFGAGHYKRVYLDSKNPKERIVAEFRKQLDDLQIKGTYYLGKLAHLIFPRNIPEPHMAANTHDGKSIFTADQVQVDPDHEKFRTLRAKRDAEFMANRRDKSFFDAEFDEAVRLAREREDDPRVKRFIADAERCGLVIDQGGQNFSIDPDGTVHYLEVNPPWMYYSDGSIKIEFDESNLNAAIGELAPEDAAKANAYLKRLLSLLNDAKAAVSSQEQNHQIETTQVDGRVYEIEKLRAYADTLPEREVPLDSVRDAIGEGHIYWVDRDGKPLAPHQIIQDWDAAQKNQAWTDHVASIKRANLNDPIWMKPDGTVFDGVHRLTRAVLIKAPTIKIKIFDILPDSALARTIDVR